MKVALIIGGANNVWQEYDRALQLIFTLSCSITADYETFVINDSIPLFRDHIDHAITLHPAKLSSWAHARNELKRNIPSRVWAHRTAKLVTDHIDDWGGSSGLFACRIALHLGFNRIILCGVPMSSEFKHITRNADWTIAAAFRRGWITHMKEIKGKVKSWSGWSKEQLGEPTIEWLREGMPHNAAIA